MHDDYEILFQHLRQNDVPQHLHANVMKRIARLEQRRARLLLFALGTMTAISFAVLIPVYHYAAQTFYASDTYQYLSLFFSDSKIVLESWQEFSFSIAESIPINIAITFLADVFIFLYALKLTIKHIENTFVSIRLTYTL